MQSTGHSTGRWTQVAVELIDVAFPEIVGRWPAGRSANDSLPDLLAVAEHAARLEVVTADCYNAGLVSPAGPEPTLG